MNKYKIKPLKKYIYVIKLTSRNLHNLLKKVVIKFKKLIMGKLLWKYHKITTGYLIV